MMTSFLSLAGIRSCNHIDSREQYLCIQLMLNHKDCTPRTHRHLENISKRSGPAIQRQTYAKLIFAAKLAS